MKAFVDQYGKTTDGKIGIVEVRWLLYNKRLTCLLVENTFSAEQCEHNMQIFWIFSNTGNFSLCLKTFGIFFANEIFSLTKSKVLLTPLQTFHYISLIFAQFILYK